MGFLKHIAFYLGLTAGLASVAAAAAVLVTYLFTSKLPVVNMAEGAKPKLQLVTPDELVALFREQAHKAEAAIEASA